MATSPDRAAILGRHADRLQDWAVAQTRKLWSQMDPSDIRGSWLAIQPALLAVHDVLCRSALDAVDDYMFATAADAGFRYDVTWTADRPTRPRQTYWGASAAEQIARAPVIVLWRIKQGDDVDVAMLRGLNHLLGIMSTEAHQIVRDVTWDRVVD